MTSIYKQNKNRILNSLTFCKSSESPVCETAWDQKVQVVKAAVLAGPALVLQTAAVRAGAAAPQLPSSHSPTHFSGKREKK